MNYYIITGVRTYLFKNKYYWEDNWHKDVMSQLPHWDELTIVSPIVESSSMAPTWIEVPLTKLRFISLGKISKNFYLKSLIKLRNILNEGGVYEFPGTNKLGILSFIACETIYKERKKVITFDAPLDLLELQFKRNSQYNWMISILIYSLKKFRIWSVKKSMACIVIGQGIEQELKINKKYAKKILSLPLALEDEEQIISKIEFDKNWQKKKTNSNFMIMCADRFAPEKGVFEIVKAMEIIVRDSNRDDMVLELFSKGPCKEEILQYIERKKLNKYIRYCGVVTRENLIEKMRECDLFINLTKVLDLNRTMIEAAGQGCAILGSDLQGVSTFFTHKKSAWLVNPNSSDEISSSMELLLNNCEIRRNIAKNALKLAFENTAFKTKEKRKQWILDMLKDMKGM